MVDKQYLTVSALTKYLKRKFDVDPYLRRVYLTGEISNFRLRPRHQYFSLKDEHAKISAIMFQSAFSKIKFLPEEGMKVLVSGYISLYEITGQYQIYIDHMEPDGIGALYQAYEQLKNKLRQEGVFALPKKPIPRFPKKIAVITSPSGAVIRDIITTVQRRYPIVQLVLFPAQVQGKTAADSLVSCLNQVNQIGDFDTVIIGRGGGSIEDLWPFNEEKVARAIVDLNIPVISSVGHETDTTIADLVADLRAPTPTAAAELATPVLKETLLQLKQLQTSLYQTVRNILVKKRQLLQVYQNSPIFQRPQNLYRDYIQRVDQLTNLLIDLTQQNIHNANQKWQMLYQALKFQRPDIKQLNLQLNTLEQNLQQSYSHNLKEKRQQLIQGATNLDNLSPLKTLQRGYAIVSDHQRVITTVQKLSANQQVQVRLADGDFQAQVLQIEAKNNDRK